MKKKSKNKSLEEAIPKFPEAMLKQFKEKYDGTPNVDTDSIKNTPLPETKAADQNPIDVPNIDEPRYRCQRHGVVNQVITSNIPKKQGYWCLLCFLDMLDDNRVLRASLIPDKK